MNNNNNNSNDNDNNNRKRKFDEVSNDNNNNNKDILEQYIFPVLILINSFLTIKELVCKCKIMNKAWNQKLKERQYWKLVEDVASCTFASIKTIIKCIPLINHLYFYPYSKVVSVDLIDIVKDLKSLSMGNGEHGYGLQFPFLGNIFSNLIRLQLFECDVVWSHNKYFQGCFNSLQTLELTKVYISNFEQMLLCMPNVTTLYINEFEMPFHYFENPHFPDITIVLPKLTELTLQCAFNDIKRLASLGSSNLRMLSIDYTPLSKIKPIDLVGYMQSLMILHIDDYVMPFVTHGFKTILQSLPNLRLFFLFNKETGVWRESWYINGAGQQQEWPTQHWFRDPIRSLKRKQPLLYFDTNQQRVQVELALQMLRKKSDTNQKIVRNEFMCYSWPLNIQSTEYENLKNFGLKHLKAFAKTSQIYSQMSIDYELYINKTITEEELDSITLDTPQAEIECNVEFIPTKAYTVDNPNIKTF